MSDNNLDSLKELNDTEFAILFIDNIYKSLKRFDKPDITTSSLLSIMFNGNVASIFISSKFVEKIQRSS